MGVCLTKYRMSMVKKDEYKLDKIYTKIIGHMFMLETRVVVLSPAGCTDRAKHDKQE